MVGLHLVVLIFQTEALEHILKIPGNCAAMEINMAPGSSTDHRNQNELQQENGAQL